MTRTRCQWPLVCSFLAIAVVVGCTRGGSAGSGKSSKSDTPETDSEIKKSWEDYIATVKANVAPTIATWRKHYKEGLAELKIEDFSHDMRKEVTKEDLERNREEALKNAPNIGMIKFKSHEQLGDGFFEDYDYELKFLRKSRAWIYKEGKVKLTNSKNKTDPRLGTEVPLDMKMLEGKFFFKQLLGLK